MQRFDQLTSLTVQLDYNISFEDSLLMVAALDSLRQLRCLELAKCDVSDYDPLLVTLRRLCSEQLLHVSLSRVWLDRLARQWRADGQFTYRPMPSVRSFRFVEEFVPAAGLLSEFTSLTHLDTRTCGEFFLGSAPSLSSLRLVCSDSFCPAAVDTSLLQTVVLASCRYDRESGVQELMSRTSGLRQFAASGRGDQLPIPFDDGFFKACERPFANLIYLQLDGALRPPHWRYLFTPAAPPPFAATLTHFLLQCEPWDPDLATSLLPNLPSVYRALRGCHVSLPAQAGRWMHVKQRSQWDGVVRQMREELGAAWCEHAIDVIAGRSDMVWRREANVQYVDD